MTNTYEVNDLVEFCVEHDINVKQFFFCILLLYDKKYSRIEGKAEISRPLSKLYKYFKNVEKFSKEELQDLVDKGFLEQWGKKFKPDSLEVTDKFEKKWYGEKYKFNQFEEVYPNKTMIDGKEIAINGYDDPPQMIRLYNSIVKTYKMHNRVMELTEWGRENNLINMNIKKYIASKQWENLKRAKDNGGSLDNQTVI